MRNTKFKILVHCSLLMVFINEFKLLTKLRNYNEKYLFSL